MSLFNRIAIGTANWGKKYRGHLVHQDDKKQILETAFEWGIDTIDTAVAYENDVYDLVDTKKWKVIDKIGKYLEFSGKIRSYAILWHGYGTLDSEIGKFLLDLKSKGYCEKIGWSVYSNDAKTRGDIIQIPYNPYDKMSIDYVNKVDRGDMKIYVRSIYCAERALKDFTVQQCIAFALMNPKIDKVILGFANYKQFRDDLEWIHDLESKGSYDPNVYDTRRF
jgi:hypothetical protein